MARRTGLLSCAALALAGATLACATTHEPREQMGRAEQAVSQAEQLDAEQHAAADLQLAREKLASARAAVVDDENTRARRNAEQAEVDALLASARTRQARAQTASDELEETVRALKEEIRHDAP